ncbi:DUF808 domain-containing protein [Flavobacterium solisilvae]|uniref:DUF808 domain-containing protein n=1 Tax=Flavobacterium solisilvae TaxID=1852019 RepID=A0ABX1QPH2_9FLAO|nr:DUF808 domain-containing protein [Flavobacterium solisilvae]NMH23947.1 DUF808 domain-containing protein [Flavobacterium solisilvae]
MASGFFAILDDIAALMDDVAVTSKLATQKTAGILGDDLAVNAEKATGFLSSRELPVLWAITKGSFINKLIILPVVFLLNYFFPVLITIILVLGGIYLAYEGAEKIVEFIFHRSKKGHEVLQESVLPDTAENSEKSKIGSAIKTDFILSLEIVIIALATVIEHEHPLLTQILSVSFVAIIATIGVYGIVALIVRMDDAGYFLIKKSDDKGLLSVFGQFLVKALPMIIKILSVVGTIALLLVSGGIFVHNIDFFHHLFPTVPSIVKDFGFGLIVGLLTVGIVMVFKSLFSAVKK